MVMATEASALPGSRSSGPLMVTATPAGMPSASSASINEIVEGIEEEEEETKTYTPAAGMFEVAAGEVEEGGIIPWSSDSEDEDMYALEEQRRRFWLQLPQNLQRPGVPPDLSPL